MTINRALAACLILAVTAILTFAAGGTVVATVNDEAITTAQLEKELVRIHTSNQFETQRQDFSLDRLVQQLINNALLEQEARAVGLDTDSAVVAAETKFRNDLAYRIMLSEVFPDTFTASEEEIRAIFERDFQKFDLQLICVTDTALARVIADSIRCGASMETLAAEHAVDRYKTEGGHAGYWATIDLPEDLRPIAIASKDGEVIGPMELWRTQAVVRINNRREPDASQLDSVRAAISAKVVQDKREASVQAFSDSLLKRTTVTVDSGRLDEIIAHMREKDSQSDLVVARIGSESLSESDLRHAYVHRAAMRPERDAHSVLRDVLDEQIRMVLLRDAALERRFTDRDTVKHETKMFTDSLLVEAYLEDVVQASIHVTPEEIENYYRDHQPAFQDPPRLKIATLTRKAKDEAEADFQTLRAGTDFAWLARKNSTDEARDLGGVHEWMRGDELPLDVFKALDTFKIGEISPPMAVDSSFTIFLMQDREEGSVKALAKVTDLIRSELMKRKQFEAIDKTLKALRQAASIQVKEDAIKQMKIVGRNAG